MKFNKKSQATIFMVVAVVLVIGLGIFFYTTSKVQQQFEPEIQIVQEQVPLEFDPVRKYANDCAYGVGIEALRLAGKQGGYVSLSGNSLSNEQFTITQNPTESDAVSFTQESELKIPY